MADTTQGDTDRQYLALGLIVLIAGLLIHSFIICVNVTDWWKGRSVTPVDHIVTSLGISRMGTQIITILHLFVNILFQIKLDANAIPLIGSIYDFFTYVNFWLTSLLSIVFCLKICNLHTRLFLYLRGMIIHRTGYLIGASVILSALNCLMLLTMALTELLKGGRYNTTKANLSMNYTLYINYIYIYVIGSFFPLLFYCISAVLLLNSLYHHTTQMKMSSNLSINLETYYSVMKLVSFTFIYNTIYFIGHFFCVIHYFIYYVGVKWLYIVLEFLPVLHSSYLIYKTTKLRSQMSKLLQNINDFLFKMKSTKTRENIEIVAL